MSNKHYFSDDFWSPEDLAQIEARSTNQEVINRIEPLPYYMLAEIFSARLRAHQEFVALYEGHFPPVVGP